VILGYPESGTSGFLTSAACTPYYVTVDLEPGDPAIINNNFPFQAEYQGSVVGRIWWDVNRDGRQDPDEPGIPGVGMVLPDDLTTVSTDAGGHYTFTDVAAGERTVAVAAEEFGSGGTLEAWVASPQDVAPDDVDSDGHEVTHDVTVSVEVGAVATVDFGFDISAGYEIGIEVDAWQPVRVDEPVTISVRITNTGSTPIASLPLQQVYDTGYLGFGHGDATAHPAPADDVDDGQLDWSDLTVDFGQDLLPGASFEVTVFFTARQDTSGLPGGETETTASVPGAEAGPGSIGPLWVMEELEQLGAVAGVTIVNPTNVVLESFQGLAQPEGALLAWSTGSEVDVVGFNLLRSEAGGEFEVLNEQLIFAEFSGTERGSAYSWRDTEGDPGKTYEYALEVVGWDGSAKGWEQVSVSWRWWVELPLVL
jgi:hypothetical protein